MHKLIEVAVREALRLFQKNPNPANIAKAAEKVMRAAAKAGK